MNLFNRIVMVLLLIAGIIAIPIVMFVPEPILRFVINELMFLEANLAFLNRLHLALMVVGAVVLIPFVLLLWLELRRPRKKMVKVAQVTGGQAQLTTDAVAQGLQYYVDQLAGVIRVKPKIFSKRKGVEVVLDVETSPDVEVPAKSEEISQVARRVVEERMGLKLQRININIRHAPYPKVKPGGLPLQPPSAPSDG